MAELSDSPDPRAEHLLATLPGERDLVSVDVESSETDTDHPDDTTHRRWLSHLALAAAAVIVAVVAVALFSGSEEGSVVDVTDSPQAVDTPATTDQDPPGVTDSPAPSKPAQQPADSTDDVYLAPGETLLRLDPVVVQAGPGPEPLFDVASLGDEVTMEPVNDIEALINWAERSIGVAETETIVRIVAGGVVEDSSPAFVVYYDGVDLDGAPMRWLCTFRDRFAGSCGGSTPAEYTDQPGEIPVYDISRPNYTLDNNGYVSLYPLPDQTAVVSLVTADRSMWQRPLGAFAIFPTDLVESQPFDISAFDRDGNVLVQNKFNDPADQRQYPTTGP